MLSTPDVPGIYRNHEKSKIAQAKTLSVHKGGNANSATAPNKSSAGNLVSRLSQAWKPAK